MRALDRLHVEVSGARSWMCADSGIAGVCEGAGLSVAEAGDIVFVATEVLFLCGSEFVSFALRNLSNQDQRT
jgi:hypothetical protein